MEQIVVPTGFDQIDQYFGSGGPAGLPVGLHVLAGRSGVGKTALAANIMLNANAAGFAALYVTLEMPKENLFMRLLANAGSVEHRRINSGHITDSEDALLRSKRLEDSKWCTDDYPRNTVSRICDNARRLVSDGKIQLLIIDSIRLILLEKLGQSKSQRMAEIGITLSQLAVECRIPVLVISHIDHNPCAIPTVRDMEACEQGGLVQEAESLLFLHDPLPDKGEDIREVTLIDVDPGSQSFTGFQMTFNRPFMRFEMISR